MQVPGEHLVRARADEDVREVEPTHPDDVLREQPARVEPPGELDQEQVAGHPVRDHPDRTTAAEDPAEEGLEPIGVHVVPAKHEEQDDDGEQVVLPRQQRHACGCP
jgi:hypothetical protein